MYPLGKAPMEDGRAMTINPANLPIAGGTPTPIASVAQPRAEEAPAPQDQVSLGGDKPNNAPYVAAERVLNSAAIAHLVGSSLKGGDRIEIKSGDSVVLEIRKDHVSAYDNFKRFASDGLKTTAAEVSNIVAQDPAFAFKESALGVKDQVFSGIPEQFKTAAEKGFLPMIRVVALALDGKKAYATFKSGDASPLDKFVDGGHLLTDVAGLGGAVCMALPAVSPQVATALTVAGLVGDIGAYGYHVMKYFQDRGMAIPQDPPQAAGPKQPSQPGTPNTP